MGKYLHAVSLWGFKKLSLSFFSIILISFSFAQVKFSAASNETKIGKNEYLQIQFTVENAANVESISPPAFKDFAVVSGPNQQSSMSNINGSVKQSLSIGFVLQPLSTGTFKIPPAFAKVDGKQYQSNSLSIQVTNSASSNSGRNNLALSPFGNLQLDLPSESASHQFDDYILKKGESVADKIKKNLFIKIDVNKKECFVGEPITATYKLFTRLKSESNVLKAPSFNGFSVSELEMPDNFTLKTEKYNGREYNVYVLRKVQLYPLQSGRLSLEPVEVKNRITFIKAEYAGRRKGDIFFDLLRDFADENAPGESTEQQVVTLKGDTMHINVKPLPDANKPADFKSAVGNFKINATVEKSNITTDDAGSLKIIISGSGNIQLINAPNLEWPQGIEGFESKASENIDKLSFPLKGDKVFAYPFTISKPGDYIIPAVNFSYFDISTQSYKTVTTKPLPVHVEKGTGNSQKIINTNNTNEKHDDNGYNFINADLIYFVVSVLLFSVLLLLFFKKRKSQKLKNDEDSPATQDISETKSENIDEFIIPSNPLAEAEEQLAQSDTSQFYKVLDVSFHKYLSDKLNVPAEELTKKKINERMDKCNVGVGTTLLVNSVLEDIELNLYAPVSTETQMHEVYEKASEAVSLLDKQVC